MCSYDSEMKYYGKEDVRDHNRHSLIFAIEKRGFPTKERILGVLDTDLCLSLSTYGELILFLQLTIIDIAE